MDFAICYLMSVTVCVLWKCTEGKIAFILVRYHRMIWLCRLEIENGMDENTWLLSSLCPWPNTPSKAVTLFLKKNNSNIRRLESPCPSLALTICPHNPDTFFVHIAYNSFHMVRSGYPLYGSIKTYKKWSIWSAENICFLCYHAKKNWSNHVKGHEKPCAKQIFW